MSLILGLSLVLASGIGIASAMESQLARKNEEIGMLRAVGATRRQIRRIFGRETWLLTLVLSPLSVGMGVLAAWGVAKIAPDKITFAPEPVILLPILLFTALMMLLSSRLPLRKAAAIAPMQVIKDAATMRKARRFKIKKQFKPAALLAGRELRLHPTRQLGAAVIVTAMLLFVFCMTMTFELVSRENTTAFVLLPQTQNISGGFSQIRYPDYLSAQSVQELAQLPQVSAVREIRTLHVFSAVDAIGAYIPNSDKRSGGWKTDEAYQQSQEAEQIRARLNLDDHQVLLNHNLIICADADALRSYVAEGSIDLAALDAGREVLIYLPETWVSEGNFGGMSMVSHELLARYTAHEVNDQFHPGDSLPLYQLICDGADTAIVGQNDVANMELHQADVKIGAVLTGKMDNWYSDGTVITTPKGLQALGFWQGNQERVLLEAAGELNDDAEDMLTQAFNRIAMRGGMQVINYISYYRQEQEAAIRQRVTFGAVILLFFAVSVSMVVTGTNRRLQSDRRTIGTLRAVGANAGVIFRCYAGQALIGVGLGTLMGLLLTYLMYLLQLYYGRRLAPAMLMEVGTAALCALCCLGLLRLRVKQMVHQPIVEMIKEL